MNIALSSGLGMLPSNTITNLKEDLKGITTRSGIAYKGPTIPTNSSPPKVVERETNVTKDTVPPTNNESTKDVQLSVAKLKLKYRILSPLLLPLLSQLKLPFADTLIPMPKFASTIKSLLTNKEKLFELARTPLNEHCSAVLLKKLPEKLGDPGKFLSPCDFSGMDECLALADLGASINLMPLSVWNKLSLPELSPTCMTLELADRSISRPVGVAEDVSVKEVLGISVSGNPTPSTKPIVSTSSPTPTPFGDSDFLLEETDAFLAIEDEPISSKINDSYYDPEEDILLLEEFLNDDPSSPPLPPQELKNDREDIGKLGAKGDIGFFIGYSADSCAYRVYNRRTKKIIETMNVSIDELSVMAFEQSSLKPRLQSMTSGHISSGLDLTYAPSTITTQ
nr:reverse transcriptase domain-containing protein [Tanacetum cinerariifolium]